MDFAITSLPVPVSPRMRTAQSAEATVSTSSRTARNFGLDPTKSEVSTVYSLPERFGDFYAILIQYSVRARLAAAMARVAFGFAHVAKTNVYELRLCFRAL